MGHIVLDTRAGTEQLGFVFLGKAGVNALRGDRRSNATGIVLDGGCTWHLSGQLSQLKLLGNLGSVPLSVFLGLVVGMESQLT